MISSVLMIGVGQTGINITLDLMQNRLNYYYDNKKESDPEYVDPYLTMHSTDIPPQPNCNFVDFTSSAHMF